MVTEGIIARGGCNSLADGYLFRGRAICNPDINSPILQVLDAVGCIALIPSYPERRGAILYTLLDECLSKG